METIYMNVGFKMAKRIKVEGLKELNNNINKLTKTISLSKNKTLKKIGKDVLNRSQVNIIESNLLDSTKMFNSSYISEGRKGLFETIVEVGYKEEHAIYQHEGWKGQNMPPFQPILDWVESKVGLAGEEAEGFAYLVSLKLKNKGHKAEPFLGEALDSELVFILEKLKNGIREDLIKKFR